MIDPPRRTDADLAALLALPRPAAIILTTRPRPQQRRARELRFDALLLADGAMFPAGGRAAIEAFLGAPDPEG